MIKNQQKTCNGCMKTKLYTSEWAKIGIRNVCPACKERIYAANKRVKRRFVQPAKSTEKA